MATTIAQISLSSSDLLTNALALSDTATLTIAGDVTGLTQTSGLGRTTAGSFTPDSAAGIQATTLYRGDDALTNGANKVYLKNTSANAAQYFTIHIDGEELGRLYAGDWAFFPWSATAGTKATFTVTLASTWAVGDTWIFDGVTMTAASTATAGISAQIDGLNYPNWTTEYVATESTVVFHARYSGGREAAIVTGDGTLDTAGSGTANINLAAKGIKSEADISIRPSVHTGMTMEHILFHE